MTPVAMISNGELHYKLQEHGGPHRHCPNFSKFDL